MAKKVIGQSEQWWYTPHGDLELVAEEQSAFKFRPLTKAEQMHALDNMEVEVVDARSSERQLRFRSFQQAYQIVLACLTEARNYPAGEPVEYVVDVSREKREAYLELMRNALIYELGHHVFDRSTLGPAEKKSLTP